MSSLVYLSGPISAAHGFTQEQNIEEARCVFYELMHAGLNVICPHVMICRASGLSYERLMEFDFALIDACRALVMMPRWRDSPGAVREHDYAQMNNKLIVYDYKELLP